MRSLELIVNGRRVAIAGDPEAVLLELRCTLSIDAGHAYYALSAQSERDKYGKSEYLLWVDDKTKKLSSLELNVVNTDTPDKWRRKRATTHWWNKDGEPELMCSFCGKLQSEAVLLVKKHGASICEECSKIAHDTMVKNGAYPSGEA